MNALLVIAAFAVTLALVVLWPQKVSAHCDTVEGPTARDGVKALESEVGHPRGGGRAA